MKSKNLGIVPRRGEVWWVSLDPALGSEIAKTRPCVVLSRDIINQIRRTVVVVPLSSSPSAHPPIHIAVQCGGKPAVAVVDQVRAISKLRFKRKIGSLSGDEMDEIAGALRQVSDLLP